jgi:hypothetical protein
MTIPAVRTSLSKEGFKLDLAAAPGESGRREDDKGARLSNADALLWLSRRRGFVPNRAKMDNSVDVVISEIFDSPDLSFDRALRKAMVASRKNADQLADRIGASSSWIESILSGRMAGVDVMALRNLANELKVPEPEFVAMAVRHLISIELAQNS